MNKINVVRKSALDALSIGGCFAGKNKVIPILDCVKVRFTPNGAMAVSSHDGSNAIVKRVEGVECAEDSVFCINYADFLKALKSLSCDVVDIEVDDKFLTIVHKKGCIELPIQGVDEFPNVDLGEVVYEMDMESAQLKGWVSTARNFVATDELRPAMSGMYLYVKNEEIGVCATNGQKMYADNIACEGLNGADISAIIPASCLSPILSVIGDSESVKVMFYGRNVKFITKDTQVVCLLQDGRYPNFKAVIPTTHQIEVECEVAELHDSVSRVCTLAGGVKGIVKFDIKDMTMNIESEDIDFAKKANEECLCSHSGRDIVFGANGEMLCACLNAIDNDKVVMRLIDESHAVVLHDNDNPRKTLLFMPLMLS